MNKLIYSILLSIISILSIYSQNKADPQRIIDDFLKLIKTEAIKTSFTLKVSEKNAVNSQTNSGTFIMKSNRFYLEMEGIKVWFDGKTQWAYVEQNNEVSITEPTDTELSEINLMTVLSNYRSKSTIRFSKTNSVQNYIIEMIPKIKNKDVSKLEIFVNKKTNELIGIKLFGTKGNVTALNLTNFKKGINTENDTFIFNKTKVKNVSVNDLR